MEVEWEAKRFHVGDRVIISENVSGPDDGEFRKYCGYEARIMGVGSCYTLDIDDGDFAWFDCDLEPYEETTDDELRDINMEDFLNAMG